jgi:hypothetical protein
MARVFQAYSKNTAKYFLTQDLSSGTPQIHSAPRCDGPRFDTTCIFYSQANFGNAGNHYSHMIPLQTPVGTWYPNISLHLNMLLPADRVSSVRHKPVRCRSDSSCMNPAYYLNPWLVGVWRLPLKRLTCHALCQPILWRKVFSTRLL